MKQVQRAEEKRRGGGEVDVMEDGSRPQHMSR